MGSVEVCPELERHVFWTWGLWERQGTFRTAWGAWVQEQGATPDFLPSLELEWPFGPLSSTWPPHRHP